MFLLRKCILSQPKWMLQGPSSTLLSLRRFNQTNVNPNVATHGTQETEKNDHAAAKLTSMDPEMKSLKEKYDSMHNKYLTCLADMENLRIRTRKDVEQASLYSITKFAKDLLSVADVLELAISKHLSPTDFTTWQNSLFNHSDAPSNTSHISDPSINAPPMPNQDEFLEGVKLTYRELLHIFRRFHIEPILEHDLLHKKYDPNLHLALFQIPKSKDMKPPVDATSDDDPLIIKVEKKGYRIKDRILRPPEVGIAK